MTNFKAIRGSVIPFNINEFKANGLIYGGARPTQFQVDLFLPFASVESQRQKFLIKAASLPDSIIQPVEVRYFGRKTVFAGDRAFQAWEVQCYNDEDFSTRSILERWQNEINTLISNRMSNDMYATKYKASAEVTQFGKNGKILRVYRFSGLFPVQVGVIGLDWDAQNQIEMFPVTFEYDYWEPIVQTSATDRYSPYLEDDQVFGGDGDTNATQNGGSLLP